MGLERTVSKIMIRDLSGFMAKIMFWRRIKSTSGVMKLVFVAMIRFLTVSIVICRYSPIRYDTTAPLYPINLSNLSPPQSSIILLSLINFVFPFAQCNLYSHRPSPPYFDHFPPFFLDFPH